MSAEIERVPDASLVNKAELTDESRPYEAYKLRQAGYDWTFVANEAGYADAKVAETSVRHYLQRAALSLDAERRMEILQLQTDRIESLITSQWHKAMDGDTKAAEFCLRAVAQLARTYGLEELHTKQGQSTKTIVIAGTSEEYAAALKHIAETS